MTISQETRRESLETFDAESLRREIWNMVCDSPAGLSPWQAYEKMGGKNVLWAIRPRFTELKALGLIRVAGKRKGPTGKSEAYYVKSIQPLKLEFDQDGQGAFL